MSCVLALACWRAAAWPYARTQKDMAGNGSRSKQRLRQFFHAVSLGDVF
jgi:hypothetical protein